MATMTADQRQELRKLRAMTETFIVAHIDGDEFLVHSSASNKMYSVIGDQCECEDFRWRGGACKHQIAIQQAVERDEVK